MTIIRISRADDTEFEVSFKQLLIAVEAFSREPLVTLFSLANGNTFSTPGATYQIRKG